jgi:hypothetical protein
VTTRQLFDSADEGRYNREWTRLYFLLSTYDWPCRDVTLALTGELWDSDDNFESIAFEADWHPSRCWRLTVGTDWALYRFDFYAAEERRGSRAGYLRLRWRPTDSLSFLLRLRLEDDEYDTYFTLNTGFEFEF